MSFRIFVSYSTKDIQHVEEIQSELSSTPIELYVANHNLLPGQDIANSIKQSINSCDIFVILWSENSSSSQWVLQELGQARQLGKLILPIRLTNTPPVPDSISTIKSINHFENNSIATKEVKKLLEGEYKKYSENLMRQQQARRKQEESDNLAKLGIAGFLIWLFTRQ